MLTDWIKSSLECVPKAYRECPTRRQKACPDGDFPVVLMRFAPKKALWNPTELASVDCSVRATATRRENPQFPRIHSGGWLGSRYVARS